MAAAMIERLPAPLRALLRAARRRWGVAAPAEVERAELAFYLATLRPGMVVLDVGANVGELSLLFARLVGVSGRVVAFEACRETFARLAALCAAAGRVAIHPEHLAVAAREGTLRLNVYDTAHSGWTTAADRPLAAYGIDVVPVGVEEVAATTVDLYCQRAGIERVDLLKVDVEGAELQVLEGARRMLTERRVRHCLFEFGQTTFDMGNHPDDIERYLREVGYRVSNLVRRNRPFPGRAGAATAAFSMHLAVPGR